MLDYVVVVPAHNEQKYLRPTIRSICAELDAISDHYLLVIAEDGSTDNTLAIAKSLELELPHVVCVHHDKKLGRGLAVERVWANVDARVYAFADCDMATDLSYFRLMLESIDKDADIVTGSRYLPESVTVRPTLRKIASRGYNQIIRLLFGTGCSDHQCGFKAISFRAWASISTETICKGWEWDTEIIVRASRHGFRLKELPVFWVEKRSKRTPLKRLLNDIVEHGYWTTKILLSHSSPVGKETLWQIATGDYVQIRKKTRFPEKSHTVRNLMDEDLVMSARQPFVAKSLL